MNTSFDDQASQSTSCNDQRSETSSSANPQSPRSLSYSANSIIVNHPLVPQHQQHIQTLAPSSESNYTMRQQQDQLSNHYNLSRASHETYMYANNANLTGASYHQQQSELNHHYLQQQQQQRLSTPNGNNRNCNNIDQQKQPLQRTLFPNPRRICTGVDKLILAAMLNEAGNTNQISQLGTVNQTGAPNYLPSGRGLGYSTVNPAATRGTDSQYQNQIPKPSNKSELELFHLLERANLLIYFGTFLNFGGDDVQQLSDADEEEFLEIMSLVGMTQKPLHVRRLQKALIEWKENQKELESQFRRPQPTTSNFVRNHNNLACNETNNNDSFNSNRQVASSTSLVESPLSNSSQPYTSFPQEIVGAPKRLRLMDDLHKKSFSESEESQMRNKTKAKHIRRTSQLNIVADKATDRNISRPLASSSPNILNVNKSSDELEDNREEDEEEDDEKLIEILDSSHSDLEQEDDSNVTRATCGSTPVKIKQSHNKLSRYKASLNTANPLKNTKA